MEPLEITIHYMNRYPLDCVETSLQQMETIINKLRDQVDINTDETERKRLQRQLENAEELAATIQEKLYFLDLDISSLIEIWFELNQQD